MSSSNNLFIKRALISVSDKSGIVEFAQELHKRNIELISTGGTAKILRDSGLPVLEVSDLTKFPEMMDGRVKTLHPMIHGGLLAIRGNKQHETALKEHSISPIDMLVVNLYPFEETIASGADYETSIENIDIGGPAMIRAAAKNHSSITVLINNTDYQTVLNNMDQNEGSTTFSLRQKLAQKAYARTASYDAAIAQWMAKERHDSTPDLWATGGQLQKTLRYGENPHQQAGFYVNEPSRIGIATATQLQGKDLSYNNINDTDAAFELICEFDPNISAACAIIKHTNPCGVALGSTPKDAFEKALRCDPVSAFGGIIAFNTNLDAETAEIIIKLFTEVIIAPSIDEDAKKVIAQKPNLRLLITNGLANPRQAAQRVSSVSGGFLVQTKDTACIQKSDLRIVTKKAPSEQQLDDLILAFRIAKHVKSNAIVYAKNGYSVGIGAGQMNRLDSSRIAARKAQDVAEANNQPLETIDCVVASDAFFPFADGLLSAAKAGAKAIIQPGGSIKDNEVIAAANEAGLAMVFTDMRHFKH